MTRVLSLVLATSALLFMAPPASFAADPPPEGSASPAPPAAAAQAPAGASSAPAPGESAPPEAGHKAAPPPDVARQIERDRVVAEKAGALRAAATAHPDEARYQVAWIEGLLDLGQDLEALDAAPPLVERFPGSAEMLAAFGRALLRDGQFELAALQLQRSLAIDGSSSRVETLFGKTAFIRGDLKAAESALRKALALDKGNQDARTTLALVLERAGRYGDAIGILKGAAGKEGAPLSGKQALFEKLAKEPPVVLPKGFTSATVPFVVARGYPPFVEVQLGKEAVKRLFVIDTGSEEAQLTSEAARALGLPDRGKELLKDDEGRERPAPAYVLLDQIRLGELTVGRIPARVAPGLRYPDEKIAGTLGREFLRRFRVVLDYAARTITLSRPDGPPLDGTPFFQTSAILVDGYRGDRAVGRFVLDSSSYTPGVLDARLVAVETGLTLFSPDVKKINQGPYLFKLTMPDLKLAGAEFKSFPATATDLRSMTRQLGVDVSGILGYSLLRLCRVELDFANQRVRLTQRAAQPPPASEPAAPGAEAGS